MATRCKIVLTGDGNVGKTSLVRRFVKGEFASSYKATIGVDLFHKTVTSPKGSIKFQIWDIAGQAQFSTIRTKFYKGASAALLVFDLTMPASFTNLRYWVDDISSQKEIPIILLGNKKDLPRLREVAEEQAREFASKTAIIHDFLETSAKTGENVEKAFQMLLEVIEL